MGKKAAEKIRLIKIRSLTLYYACRDRRTPIYVKFFAFLLAAYIFSPIDLIPDFIPVIGFLDDLIIVPLGLYLIFKLIPKDIISDAERQAEQLSTKPVIKAGAFIVAFIWLILLFVIFMLIRNRFYEQTE